jgi:hypothetical protein
VGCWDAARLAKTAGAHCGPYRVTSSPAAAAMPDRQRLALPEATRFLCSSLSQAGTHSVQTTNSGTTTSGCLTSVVLLLLTHTVALHGAAVVLGCTAVVQLNCNTSLGIAWVVALIHLQQHRLGWRKSPPSCGCHSQSDWWFRLVMKCCGNCCACCQAESLDRIS